MSGIWIRALGVLLFIAASVSAQEVYNLFTQSVGYNIYSNFSGNFLGSGARAAGMGKAFLGVSDDITAITWNPAGLIGFEKPVAGLSLGSFRPRGKFDDAGPLAGGAGEGSLLSQSGSFSNVGFLGFLSPIRIRGHNFVFAASYSRQFEDLGSNYSQFSGQLPYTSGNVVYTDSLFDYDMIGALEQHAAPYAVNIGFGTRFYNNVNLGFSINVYTGNQYNRTEYLIHVPSFNAPNLLGNQTVVLDQAITLLDTFQFSGVNFTLGVKGTSGKLNYGAVVRSGFNLQVKGGRTFADTILYNGRTQTDLSVSIFADNQLVKLAIPWVIAGGIGYKPSENLLLAADLEYRPFSGNMVKRRDSTIIRSGSNNEEYFTPVDPGWFNCVSIRTGMEYLWRTGARTAPTVPLRCGFGYTQIPAPSYDRPQSLNDTATSSTGQLNLSAGTGVYWSQIHLDLSYSYTSLNRNVLTGFLVSQVLSPIISYGELKTRDHNLNLTFTGYF